MSRRGLRKPRSRWSGSQMSRISMCRVPCFRGETAFVRDMRPGLQKEARGDRGEKLRGPVSPRALVLVNGTLPGPRGHLLSPPFQTL
jgi:hypothetical protein